MYYIILEYIILIIPSKRKYSYIALLIKETWLCELIILCIKKACLRCATAAVAIRSSSLYLLIAILGCASLT